MYVDSHIGLSRGYARTADGNITVFDVGSNTSTQPQVINAKGLIAGTYLDEQFVRHGFVRSGKGKITSFDPPMSKNINVQAINKSGTVGGWYIDSSSNLARGYLRVR